jgi:hypothetical protein
MGLDVGFYKDEVEILSLRDHYDFFSMFDESIGGRVYENYDDFYVVDETLEKIEAELNCEIKQNNLRVADILKEIPDDFWMLDPRETPWEDLLCFYPAIIRLLRKAVCENGPLICGYSA